MATKFAKTRAPAVRALLGVELHAEHVVAILHRAGKPHRVLGARGARGRIGHDVAVGEVEVLAGSHVREQRRGERPVARSRNNLVPTHVGHLERASRGVDARHARHDARQHRKPAGAHRLLLFTCLGSTLLAFLEKQVKPQADAEKRHPRLDAAADDVHLPELDHGGARIGERTDAGQHDGVRPGDARRVIAHDDVGARGGKPAFDAFEISLPVIDDADHSEPFRRRELACDARVQRDGLAKRTPAGFEHGLDEVVHVIARDLTQVQRDPRVGGEGDEELAGELRVEGADAAEGKVRLEVKLTAPRYVDHREHERLVHGNVALSESVDPALVAQSAGDRGAQHDADVLDRVVGVNLDIAPRPHLQIEQAVAREGVEHVVEEGHARIHIGRTRAVEVDLDGDIGFLRRAKNRSLPGHTAYPPFTFPRAQAREATSEDRRRSSATPTETRRFPRACRW